MTCDATMQRLEALAARGWTVVAVGPRNLAARCHRVPDPSVRGNIALAVDEFAGRSEGWQDAAGRALAEAEEQERRLDEERQRLCGASLTGPLGGAGVAI